MRKLQLTRAYGHFELNMIPRTFFRSVDVSGQCRCAHITQIKSYSLGFSAKDVIVGKLDYCWPKYIGGAKEILAVTVPSQPRIEKIRIQGPAL